MWVSQIIYHFLEYNYYIFRVRSDKPFSEYIKKLRSLFKINLEVDDTNLFQSKKAKWNAIPINNH